MTNRKVKSNIKEENFENSLCENCKHLLHYKYDREVDISCFKGHEAQFYPPIIECEDFKGDVE